MTQIDKTIIGWARVTYKEQLARIEQGKPMTGGNDTESNNR